MEGAISLGLQIGDAGRAVADNIRRCCRAGRRDRVRDAISRSFTGARARHAAPAVGGPAGRGRQRHAARPTVATTLRAAEGFHGPLALLGRAERPSAHASAERAPPEHAAEPVLFAPEWRVVSSGNLVSRSMAAISTARPASCSTAPAGRCCRRSSTSGRTRSSPAAGRLGQLDAEAWLRSATLAGWRAAAFTCWAFFARKLGRCKHGQRRQHPDLVVKTGGDDFAASPRRLAFGLLVTRS